MPKKTQIRRTPKTSGKRIKFLTVLKITAAIVLTGASGYGIFTGVVSFRGWLEGTRWGCVQRTVVKGVDRFDPQKIIETAHIPFGMSIFNSNLDSAQARVDALPGVKKCRLFAYPFGRVVIKVSERQALASVYTPKVKLLDDEGVEFARESVFEMVDVPLINFLKVERTDSLTALAVEYMTMLRGEYPVIYDNLSELVLTRDQFKLRLKQGGAGILSDNVTDEVFLGELSQFLNQKGEDLPLSMEYVDLRFPQRIYIKPG